MSDLSRTLAALDPKKRELLALLARREGIDLSRTPIGPLPRDGAPRPLSFAQERLWFLDQLVPGGTAYNLPGALRLRAAIDPAVLARTFSEIARRHDALRTVFSTDGERPAQVAAPPGPVSVPMIDLAGLPDPLPEARRLAREEAGTPFDLARGPVLRVRLVRLGPDDHALLTTMHHIASDGWSTGLLIDEVVTLYAAFSQGQPSPLPELPIQYADFAAWQRQALQGAALEEQLAWWRRFLEGAPLVLDLPADRARPAVQGHRGVRAAGKLPSGVVEALAELTAREGATLFMTLLAGLLVYLSRISGQSDLCVGTPVAGRKRVETERLIGFFVNTLAVRAHLGGDPPFREALRRVRTAAVGAFEHQDTPFEKIVEEVQAERDLSRTPVFQVVLSLQNVPRSGDAAPFPIEPLSASEPGALYDLTLTATDTGTGLSFALDGNADLFEPATMRRMAGHLETLLAGIAEDSNCRLSELPLLTEAEALQVLEEWSGPALAEDPEADLPLAKRIARRAAEAPEAPAVEQDDQTLTYGELQERASTLAAHLRSMGVGPESLVAVLMDRSAEMVATLVGVMAAGAAYLPIDPGTPEERVAAILSDSGAAVTLTPSVPLSHTHNPLPGEGEGRQEETEGEGRAGAPLSRAGVVRVGEGPGVRVLAYLIYTSGSTGLPKGVEVTHGGLSSLVGWHLRAFQVDRSSRATQLAGLGFDASVWEIWPYLAAGASVRLIGSEISLDPEALADELIARGITHSFVPTPLAEGLVAALARRIEAGSSPALRFLLTGGDRLARGPERPLPFQLINAYGPTESSVVTTAGPVTAGTVNPPIGRPIAGRTVRLLDRTLRPVPAGVPGELSVGGPGLARGYRGRPDLTAGRFLPDPFSRISGDRLYATGDLARWTPEGEIEFLGRADTQVKIRGVRVEPGEIEAALRRHPGVREAAVLPRTVQPGDLRLAAYVVPVDGDLSPTELRGFLRGRLPEAMVPTAWALLDRMPVTPNGKIDRRALAKIELASDVPDKAEYVEPRTPAEAAIASLFVELLGAERVGAEDDFFALGGHSLLASRLAARVRERFGVPLPLRHFFEAPTPAALARVLEAVEAAEAMAAGASGAPGGTEEDEERETFRL